MTDMSTAVPLRARLQRFAASPGGVARLCFGSIALLGVLGVFQRSVGYFPLSHTLDLDFEWMPPALFSALLLVAAGVAFAVLVREAAVPRAGVFLAALLGFMSLDEWFGVHERLERATDVDWQILYSPLVLAAGVGTLLVLRSWGTRYVRASLLLLTAGGLWFLAQVLEKLEFTGADDHMVDHYAWLMIPEELMEMSGSTLFLLSALVVRQAVTASREA